MRDLNTMTVGDLRDLLEDFPDDARVIFTTDYGDYHHTKQALGIRSAESGHRVERSAYSNSGFALVGDDPDDDAEDDPGTYVVLSGEGR
jgi:hypothetical protein